MSKTTKIILSLICATLCVYCILRVNGSDLGSFHDKSNGILWLFGAIVTFPMFTTFMSMAICHIRKIEGYEVENSSYRMYEKNKSVVTPILYKKPQSIDNEAYNVLERTLVEYTEPSKTLLELLEDISSNRVEGAMFNAVNDAMLARLSHKLTDKSHWCDIMLKDGEVLHFKTVYSCLERYETVSTNYSAFTSKQSLGNGSFRTGTVYTKKNERMTTISTRGTTYVTNKRILYVDKSTNKTYTIQMGRVLGWVIGNDSLTVIVNDGKPYKFTMLMNFMYDSNSELFYDNVYQMNDILNLLLKKS